LFELMAERLYGGDRRLASHKLVIGSRLASFRSAGESRNSFTPEAYAALQALAALRAIQDGADYFVNTMRAEMTRSVLSLPDGWHFQHFRTEQRLGLPLDSIRLNRDDPFVFKHVCAYPGYFADTEQLKGLLRRMIDEHGTTFEDALAAAGLPLARLDSLKASQMKPLGNLLRADGPAGHTPLAAELRRRLRTEVGDGPRSFTTPVRERLAQGIGLLQHSPSSRRLQESVE
jgi:hypothetical protein